MKISCITPSVRPNMLEIVNKCLKRQTIQDFEWIVISPRNYDLFDCFWLQDPSKRKEDFYRLNGAWNKGFRNASGELFISIVDGLYFNPDCLERLWFHYQNNPKLIVSGIGHQYKELQNGKPEIEVWHDPSVSFPENELTNPQHIEWCLTSLPRQAIYDIGGVDEIYDQVAALSEKDANQRMAKLGYQFLIDKFLEYRALYHPRISSDWDEKYKLAYEMFNKHQLELNSGKRSPNVGFVVK